MFNFRIINMADGNQIIDRNLKTPYEALTPLQMVEYAEMVTGLYIWIEWNKKQEKKQDGSGNVQEILFIGSLACVE